MPGRYGFGPATARPAIATITIAVPFVTVGDAVERITISGALPIDSIIVTGPRPEAVNRTNSPRLAARGLRSKPPAEFASLRVTGCAVALISAVAYRPGASSDTVTGSSLLTVLPEMITTDTSPRPAICHGIWKLIWLGETYQTGDATP